MTAEEKAALLEELRAKHGKDLYELDSEDYGLVVFRKANKFEARALKQDRDDETRKYVADELFAKKVVVYPDPVTLEKILDEHPFASMAIMNEAFKVSGGKSLAAKKV